MWYGLYARRKSSLIGRFCACRRAPLHRRQVIETHIKRLSGSTRSTVVQYDTVITDKTRPVARITVVTYTVVSELIKRYRFSSNISAHPTPSEHNTRRAYRMSVEYYNILVPSVVVYQKRTEGRSWHPLLSNIRLCKSINNPNYIKPRTKFMITVKDLWLLLMNYK